MMGRANLQFLNVYGGDVQSIQTHPKALQLPWHCSKDAFMNPFVTPLSAENNFQHVFLVTTVT
jgi:hypothetical protein